MGATGASRVKGGVHREFPESRDRRFTIAETCREAVIAKTIIQRIRPKGIRIVCSGGNGRGRRAIICEACSSEKSQSIQAVAEERCAESFNSGQRYTSKIIESNKVSVDFVGWWRPDVGHAIFYCQGCNEISGGNDTHV